MKIVTRIGTGTFRIASIGIAVGGENNSEFKQFNATLHSDAQGLSFYIFGENASFYAELMQSLNDSSVWIDEVKGMCLSMYRDHGRCWFFGTVTDEEGELISELFAEFSIAQ